MPQWIALSRREHRDQRLLPRDGYAHARHDPVVPVLLAELNKLLPHFALGFVPRGEGYTPVALLSLDGERNLYVAPGGKWIGRYVPALLRGYPFALAGAGEEKTLAIDADQLTAHEGNALFDGDAPSATVQKTLHFLQQCEHSRSATEAATRALQQAGVIAPWPLTIQRHGADEAPKAMKGLYRVDEAALNALDAQTYATLQGAPMALAHAQLLSLSQLEQLTERARALAEQGAPPEDLNALFGEDDDELGFDFD